MTHAKYERSNVVATCLVADVRNYAVNANTPFLSMFKLNPLNISLNLYHAILTHSNRNAVAQIKQDPRHASETSSQTLPELVSAMKKICEDIESSSNHIGPPSANSRASLERRHIEHHNGKFKNAFATTVNLSYPLNLARTCIEELRAASTISTEQDQHDPPAPAKTDSSTDMTAVIAQEAQEILDIGYNEVLRLLAVFNREVYHMYPCINMEFARREIDFLFSHSLTPPSRGKHTKFDMDLIDIEITKVVLAIAMLTQNQTQSQLCSDLETHLIWNTDLVMKQEAVQFEDVIMATLMVSLCSSLVIWHT